MIYVDTSVILAQLFLEPRRPNPSLWLAELVSSELLRYEVWTRLNAFNEAARLGDDAEASLQRVSMLGLSNVILSRALRPFPLPVRTLDALHLATLVYARHEGKNVKLATYDRRMRATAEAMGIPLATAEIDA